MNILPLFVGLNTAMLSGLWKIEMSVQWENWYNYSCKLKKKKKYKYIYKCRC